MPSTLTYPGVYIEEIPSGVRPIAGVSTSDTAFVDFFKRGPLNVPVRLSSYSDFERIFGGLDARSEASYAIQQYYLNGGQNAWAVRVAGGTPLPSVLALNDANAAPARALRLEAANPGLWGANLQAAVGSVSSSQFNLVIREVVDLGGKKAVVNSEIHRNLTMTSGDRRFVQDVLASESTLARAVTVGPGGVPAPTGGSVDVTSPSVLGDAAHTAFKQFGDDPDDANKKPNDGTAPTSSVLVAGMKTLDNIAPLIFNLLCLPAAANLDNNGQKSAYSEALTYCEAKRAFVVVDIPAKVKTKGDMVTWMGSVGDSLRNNNAAVYFPRLEVPDRLNDDRPRNVAPSGTLAGVYARTDASRGIWKAPAGTDARLVNANPAARLNDLENGDLNITGVNVLRTFPIHGPISWGGRTLNGADAQASEWKYIPVRRTALYIEESLYQGLKWVVFEPNDEPLWAQIRLNVGAFMHTLFRQGAFQGQTPREAYLVKCDKETTTQADINRGVVNILVGFAPLKPAEFVIIKIQQLAGQVES